MLGYFFLQFTTIGFEKQYEKYKNLSIHRKTYYTIFISSFILFFYFTLSFTQVYKYLKRDKRSIEKDKKESKEQYYKKLKNEEKLSSKLLNGIYGILLFNSVFSLTFSLIYLFYASEEVKSYIFYDNINIILMPILMNKFYSFTLINYYTYVSENEQKKKKNLELLSGTSLISFYLFIWNLVISFIKSSVPYENEDGGFNSYNILYYVQIFSSFFGTLLVALFILIGLYYTIIDCITLFCCCKRREKNAFPPFLFCLCSFIFCFGGLWIRMINFKEYSFVGFNLGNFCNIDDQWCNIFCKNDLIFCFCCCYDRTNKCCYRECCKKHCYSFNSCICCIKENNIS